MITSPPIIREDMPLTCHVLADGSVNIVANDTGETVYRGPCQIVSIRRAVADYWQRRQVHDAQRLPC